jgi:large subunit ribosomal protein L32
MRRDRRRAANNKLKRPVQVSSCSNCGAAVMPHRVCPSCGFYKAKKVAAGFAD